MNNHIYNRVYILANVEQAMPGRYLHVFPDPGMIEISNGIGDIPSHLKSSASYRDATTRIDINTAKVSEITVNGVTYIIEDKGVFTIMVSRETNGTFIRTYRANKIDTRTTFDPGDIDIYISAFRDSLTADYRINVEIKHR